MKNELTRKIIIAIICALIVVGSIIAIFTYLGKGNENVVTENNSEVNQKNSEEKVNDDADNISVEKTKYVNEKATSKDKLAAIFKGNVIVTIDDTNIVSKFEENMGTTKALYDYYDNYTDTMLTINTLGKEGWNNITSEMDYEIDAENKEYSEKVVYEDGTWYITKGKVYDKDIMEDVECYKIYYRLIKSPIDFSYYVITKPRVETDEDAKKILEKCKSNVKLYYIDETTGNYLTGIDNESNKVDLSEYTFVNDILAKNLLNEGLSVKDSTYIHSMKKDSIKVYPKVDNSNRYFYIEFDKSYLFSDSDAKETFKLNGKKVESNKNGKFAIEGKNGKIVITTMSAEWVCDPFTKEDFIKAFK